MGCQIFQNPQKITKYSWVFVIFCGLPTLAEKNGLVAEFISSFWSKLYRWTKPTKMTEYSKKSGFAEVDQIFSGFLHALQNDDIESAVKIMNQSSGEVRRIFQPWLEESRNYLETLQAISGMKLLLSFSIKFFSCESDSYFESFIRVNYL